MRILNFYIARAISVPIKLTSFEFDFPRDIGCSWTRAIRVEGRTFNRVGSPFNTLVKYSCFISFSSLLGSPGYILEPPDRTTCL